MSTGNLKFVAISNLAQGDTLGRFGCILSIAIQNRLIIMLRVVLLALSHKCRDRATTLVS